MRKRRLYNRKDLIGFGVLVVVMVALVVIGAMVQPNFGPGGRFAAVGDAVRGWDKNILQWIGAGWLILIPVVLVALLPSARRSPGGLARVTVALAFVLLTYALIGIAMGVLIVASGQAASPPSGAGFRIGTSSGLKAAIGWILSPVPAWWVMSFWLERVRRAGP
ncbi:MAG: hypothetical protein HEQ23_07865 [Tepidisphaera sp.]